MPTNFDKLKSDIDGIIDSAKTKTDTRLAARVSSITRMTDEEVKELFPTPTDVKRLVELMEIVQSAEARNTKINQIVDNGEKFGGVILTLLSHFA